MRTAEPGIGAPSEHRVYYPALDGLRAIAVLLVFCSHYVPLPARQNWLGIGVDFFFVLSGFLITGILYESRNKPFRVRSFYIRRTLRIFPLYYLVLLVGVLLYPLLRWHVHPGLWLWPVYLGNYARFIWPQDYPQYIGGVRSSLAVVMPMEYRLDHFWSLCVEEQFYLIWPFVVFLVKDRVRLRNFCIAAVVATPLLRMVCVHALPGWLIDAGFLDRVTLLRGDSLLLGGFLALALKGPEGARVQAMAKPAGVALIGLVGLLEVESVVRFGHVLDGDYVGRNSPFALTIAALIGGVLILLALDPKSAFYRLCVHSWLRALGQRSYGFYIYHFLFYSAFSYLAVLVCGHHRARAVWATAAIAMVGSLAISWVSYRYFEAPILKLKERFTPSTEGALG